MSGLIGKAMKFARSPQGKKALSKAKTYASSPEGKQRIESVRDRLQGDKPPANPAAKPKPAAEQKAPQPDPKAPDTPAA